MNFKRESLVVEKDNPSFPETDGSCLIEFEASRFFPPSCLESLLQQMLRMRKHFHYVAAEERKNVLKFAIATA